ncbi:efflux RND transporter permease subunit, partial [Planctomycetota bacterium]
MTAVSFILGVIPLVVASGAGAASRQALGTAVFGGMMASIIIGVFMTPVLYVVVQTISEKFGGAKKMKAPPAKVEPAKSE